MTSVRCPFSHHLPHVIEPGITHVTQKFPLGLTANVSRATKDAYYEEELRALIDCVEEG